MRTGIKRENAMSKREERRKEKMYNFISEMVRNSESETVVVMGGVGGD